MKEVSILLYIIILHFLTILSHTAKMVYTNTSLFDDTNQRVEFTRPYRCLSNQTIMGFPNLGPNTTVGLWVRELEVQAFVFLEGSDGNFSTGNGIHGT